MFVFSGECLYSPEEPSIMILSVLYFSNIENEDVNSIEMESLNGGETTRGECNECI